MIDRNLARPPVATPPSATDAADLSSSPGTSSAPSSAASIPATADKSAALPNSPRQNSARRSFSDILAGSPSCATRDDAVDAVCFASPTPAQTAATQTAAVRPAVAAASPVFEPSPLPISRANKSSEEAPATESFADTSAVKKDVSAWSACDCISGERTSSSAAGSVFSQTAEHAFAKGARPLDETAEAERDKAADASAKSPSLTSADASSTAAVTSASLRDPACFDTSASSAKRLAWRSGLFVLRRKPANSTVAAAADSPIGGLSSDVATAPIALTAASRVISFLSLSRSSLRHRGKSAPMASPSIAAVDPAHAMAASLTS
mmetsp:Transcript_10024/g.45918  ORF Transcript_10024/g.45918 Transcript_10024/m.45918 type:complete len:322 (+) Transcript_10024:2483-3448(+)